MHTTRIRSYVIRGRRTDAQARAFDACSSRMGLSVTTGWLDYASVFGREGRCFLEIGFGSGTSLIALASAQPDHHFIGIETHQPGVGALCMGIEQHQLTNLRFYQQDGIDVLTQAIPPDSLDGVQIFFPDPWPKRRHIRRRLIQPDFIQLVVSRLKPGGFVHLATDWADYAEHMMCVLSSEPQLVNLAGAGQFASRSAQRPVITKFEKRALSDGRTIRDMQFEKIKN